MLYCFGGNIVNLNRLYHDLIVFLEKPSSLLCLLSINFIGSIYGFYWYQQQLSETPGLLKLFVPDSPTASTLFTLAVFFIIIKRPKPFITTWACAWLIKYGLWAVVINLHCLVIGGNYTFTNFHLTLSHLGMAIEGFLFMSKTNMNKYYIWIVIMLMLLNDVLDYGIGIHPWLFAKSQGKIAFASAILLTAFTGFYCKRLYQRQH